MKIQTQHLNWHLQNNVLPSLTESTIDKIINECERFNRGEIGYDTPVANGQLIFGEMIEDLKIDLID